MFSVIDYILAGGRSSQPIKMFDDAYQAVIQTARLVNLGQADVAVLQAQLDAQFGPGEVNAADVTLKRAPTGTFVVIEADDGSIVVKSLDIDIGLDPDSVRFVFDDGATATGFLVYHPGPVAWVTGTVDSCGVTFTSRADKIPTPEQVADEAEQKEPAKPKKARKAAKK